LQTSARLYAALLNTDNEFWTTLGTGTKDAVETLLRLNLEQIRILLLAAMQHFPDTELKRLLAAAVAWGVRGLFVGGIGGGRYEREYCDAAVKIRSGDIKTADELFEQLADLVPTDEEFRSAFAVARVTRANLARYYLVALENGRHGDPEPELVPNEDEEEVNLEHVLPKNPDAGWEMFTPEQARAFAHRLGNQALLKKSQNDRIGNKPYGPKRPILLDSELQWTQEAGSHEDWTPDVISLRQAEMAELAITVWPRQPA
jgi:hypothetical protein